MRVGCNERLTWNRKQNVSYYGLNKVIYKKIIKWIKLKVHEQIDPTNLCQLKNSNYRICIEQYYKYNFNSH